MALAVGLGMLACDENGQPLSPSPTSETVGQVVLPCAGGYCAQVYRVVVVGRGVEMAYGSLRAEENFVLNLPRLAIGAKEIVLSYPHSKPTVYAKEEGIFRAPLGRMSVIVPSDKTYALKTLPADTDAMVFDETGKLVRIVTGVGVTQLTYRGEALIQIADEQVAVSLEWQDGLLVGTRDNRGNEFRITWDSEWRLAAVALHKPAQQRLVAASWDGALLVGLTTGDVQNPTDTRTQTERFVYLDPSGVLQKLQVGSLRTGVMPVEIRSYTANHMYGVGLGGAKTAHSYDEDGNLVEIAASQAGQFVRKQFSSSGLLLQEDSSAGSVSYGYDDRQRLVEMIVTSGTTNTPQRTRYYYDALDRLTRIEADGLVPAVTELVYHGDTSVLAMRRENGSEVHYNTLGLPTLSIGPNGAVLSQASYDPRGNPTRITTAAGGTTHRTYTADGQLASVVDNNGNKVSYEYSPHGEWVRMWGNGVLTAQRVVDSDGRVLQLIDHLVGKTTTYVYNARGQVERFTVKDNDRTELVVQATTSGNQLPFDARLGAEHHAGASSDQHDGKRATVGAR